MPATPARTPVAVTSPPPVPRSSAPSSATVDPATAPALDPAPAAATAPAPVASGRRRVGRLTLALALVAVLTLAGGVAFAVKAHQLRSTDSASNLALVDTALTNEVVSSVSGSLNRIFTYDYADPAATQQAAKAVLVGDASSQYQTLFDTLQSAASGQQLTLKTTTVLGGVTSLTPDSARLLVFLDQSSTRASDSSSSTAAAQLDVAAVKRDGAWRISEIRPL